MPTPTYETCCIKNVNITHDVYEIEFEKPEGFTFEAGQFVLFQVPLPENPVDTQPRAYSIASAPHEAKLLFVIKVMAGGRASRWVAESLKEGDTVHMQGPFGRFFLQDSPEDILMVCTGTGIAPFRSHLLTMMETASIRNTHLFFGNYKEEDIFWKEYLEKMDAQNDWFTFVPVLSNGSQNWHGQCGFVQDAIAATIDGISSTHLYICGNPAMAEAVKKTAMEEWGMKKEKVHVEGFI
ncbi:hypothetical protein COU76_05435 [Candidatus Peregrinibacteria bacterium CG10_big_fil_rev_8_21_14_0_10_49_10]|nr:MAG: hypothetical protein COU76_05435 [Candidatus Peregrinibacteria bacterium CG10_big_fil_rev_8_21_14_0_10_49_10]